MVSESDILLVDDDARAREAMVKVLQQDGHCCTQAHNGAEALQALQGRAFDLLLLNARLPDTDGFRLLHALQGRGFRVPTIMLSAQPSVPGALKALSCRVSDFLAKPVHSDLLLQCVREALQTPGPAVEYVWRHLQAEHGVSHVLSRNPRMRETYAAAARVAGSRAPVLIRGESGTGKEYLARDLHLLSNRACEPFVILNSGALPEELLESELFGHEKGAYTSATAAKPGLCELADKGTLFLDEVGDMSPRMQVKLLRFLQDGSFRRLGGTQERQVDVRIVAATNQDLVAAVQQARFREDLYWRINVIALHLPPLRERPEDLELFSEHFLTQFAQELDSDVLCLAPETLRQMRDYMWPGNLRQLHNVLWRASLIGSGGVVAPEDLFFESLTG